MHALSKKLYYDVMKSGQEDTILESDVMDEESVPEESPRSTSDVGCFTRTHTKSYAVQTQWSRSDKNFRNEYTNTNEEGSSMKSRDIAVHQTISCADLAINRARSVQTSSVACQKPLAEDAQKPLAEDAKKPLADYAKKPLSESGKRDVVMEVRGFQIEKRGFAQLRKEQELSQVMPSSTKGTKTETSQFAQECTTNTECITQEKGHDTCDFTQYQSIPCKRGVTACRNFTLGTAEYRRCQNEQCSTKLIAGCRVPVCKNQKCRL